MNQTELDQIKQNVENEVNPCKLGWDKLKTERYSSLSYTTNATDTVWADGGTSNKFTSDILAAWSHALQWSITGNQANADKAIEILNAWSLSLKCIENKPSEYIRQEVLVAGWTAQPLAETTELLRYSNAGWDAADIARFEIMLKTIFTP
ncbi:MAG: hypothetical protein HC830_14490 [Bacteroidetes bacterium]|nr:hypothetical protein [Bacteroidota bacterium]